MSDINSLVAVYENHVGGEAGVRKLHKSGFDMTRLSIAGQEYPIDKGIVGCYTVAHGFKYWGKMEAFWGPRLGLTGTALVLLPGIGPVVFAGPLAAGIAAVLDRAVSVGGFTALNTALAALGIPKNRVVWYESNLRADRFLLLAHGSARELLLAKDLLHPTGPEEVDLHFDVRGMAA
jgi:hypothetical protein